MVTPEEIQQIASKISLTLDTPESVKLQVKRITLAQKELKVIKKELSGTVRSINQRAAQASADSFSSVVSNILGKRKLAGSIRADKRKAIQRQKQTVRQPYLELEEAIEQLILEGDRLKLLAEEYLLDPEGVTAHIQAEEERRHLEEEEREKRHKEAFAIPFLIGKTYWELLDTLLNKYKGTKQQAEKLVQSGRYQTQEEAERSVKLWGKIFITIGLVLLGMIWISLSNTTSNYEVAETQKLETTSPESISETPQSIDIIETPKTESQPEGIDENSSLASKKFNFPQDSCGDKPIESND